MLREYLSNIADKFRTYLDTTEPINAQDFAGKVEDVAVRYNQLGFTSGYNQGLEEGKPLGKLELLQDSEYMNAKVSGAAIAVNDVSPIEHSVGCSVASKNLLPYSRFSPTKTINGITFTNNGDGSITLNGTATSEAIFACIDETKAISLKAGTYTLSGGLNSNIWLQGKIVEDDSFSIINRDRAVTFTFNENFSFRFNIRVTSGTVCENVVIKTQLELGTTATAYTPYVADVGGIEVSRYGKNLFDKDFASVSSNWIYHTGGYRYIKVFVGKGNTVTVSYQQDLVTDMDCPYAMIKLSPDGGSEYWIYHQTVNGLINKKVTVTSIEDYIYVRANVFNDETYAKFMQYIGNDLQIEISPTATPYEPYIKPTTYQSTADGTVDGIKSISPNMTLLSNNNGVVINANYLRDIDTYIDNLITNVALTGGE